LAGSQTEESPIKSSGPLAGIVIGSLLVGVSLLFGSTKAYTMYKINAKAAAERVEMEKLANLSVNPMKLVIRTVEIHSPAHSPQFRGSPSNKGLERIRERSYSSTDSPSILEL
jgi:hypothetical protein